MTLKILDRHSWTPLLHDLVGDILDWSSDLASHPHLDNSDLESALRGAVQIAEPALMNVADQVATNRVTSDELQAASGEIFAYLDLGIPPVATARPASPWLLISAAWLHEVRRRGEGPAALPAIAVDSRLNRFLLKSVELLGIARIWNTNDSPAS